MILVLDNPDHWRIRKLVAKAFTPASVRAIRDRASAIAGELVDAHAAERRMDVVADFAFPFPMRVIGAILGLPDADHDVIGRYATALNPVLEFLPMSPEVLATANDAVGELTEYFTTLAAKRRAGPTDDLFSALVHATEDGDRLDDQELIANAILLYVAGHETTAGGTGLAVANLGANPAQWELLRRRPELIPNAAEELLRHDTPGQGTARVVMADTAIGDTPVAAGSFVLAYLGAANRDPDAYPDPDVLDLTRDLGSLPRPATWGGGAHFCLGRHLALHEFEIALETLLSRCPGYEIEALEHRPTPLMRGLERLEIRW
ncbi:MAG: cytochrome P450 [Actinomycetota bacterium]